MNSSRRMSCAAAAVVRACPRGEAFSGRLGSRSSFLLAQNCKTSRSPSKPSTHTRGRCGGSPHRATPRPQTSNRTSLGERVHERVTPPRSADASPRAVPPKDHALLLLPPASVPPSLSASLAPRWPHGATDRAQTSSFSNLFFFVSPPLFLSSSLLLRPSSLFLPLFFPHAPEARTDQTRSVCCFLKTRCFLLLPPAAGPPCRRCSRGSHARAPPRRVRGPNATCCGCGGGAGSVDDDDDEEEAACVE